MPCCNWMNFDNVNKESCLNIQRIATLVTTAGFKPATFGLLIIEPYAPYQTNGIVHVNMTRRARVHTTHRGTVTRISIKWMQLKPKLKRQCLVIIVLYIQCIDKELLVPDASIQVLHCIQVWKILIIIIKMISGTIDNNS